MTKTAKQPGSDIALLEGDCLQLVSQLRAGSIDLVLSDPPYGLTEHAFDRPVNWPLWWSEIYRVAKPQAVVALFAQQPFTTELINSNRAHFRYDLVWEKSNPKGFLNAGRRPLAAHEQILIFSQEPNRTCYNPQKEYTGECTYRKSGGAAEHYGRHRCVSRTDDGWRHPRSVLHFPTIAPGQYAHPNQKPLGLVEYLVRTYSQPTALVLDPFSGSGTTALACANTGRRCVAIEQEGRFVKAARDRLAQQRLLTLPEPGEAVAAANLQPSLFDTRP